MPWFEVIVANGFPIATVASFPLNERGEGFLGRRPGRSFETHIRTVVNGTVVAHERQRPNTDNHDRDHAKHCGNDHSGMRLHPLSLHVLLTTSTVSSTSTPTTRRTRPGAHQ